MKPAVAIKLTTMLISLAVVLYVIFSLKKDPSESSWFSNVFGGAPAGEQAYDDYLSYNLCRSRVASIELANGSRIEEVDRKWQAIGPEVRELDYIAMEKWLGKYCRIHVKEKGPPPAGGSPLLVLKFVNGKELAVLDHPDGLYSAEELSFESKDLQSALSELEQLSGLQVASSEDR